jgi:hypothetical protein
MKKIKKIKKIKKFKKMRVREKVVERGRRKIKKLEMRRKLRKVPQLNTYLIHTLNQRRTKKGSMLGLL